MRYVAVGFLVVLLGLIFAVPGRVAEKGKEEPLADEVRKAIDDGVAYLRGLEGGRGELEKLVTVGDIPTGGPTALATLALLHAGVPPEDPVLDRLLKYLRTIQPDRTYFVGLQTMVFALAGKDEDKERIQRNVDWLIKAASRDGKGKIIGWGYLKNGPTQDNSNTQYALLGLHEGFLAGADIKAETWEEIYDYYVRTQNQGGGWSYRNGQGGSSFTMSTAGLCGLLIASMDLKTARNAKNPPDCDGDCGGGEEDAKIAAAMKLVGANMPRTADQVGRLQPTFYALYGVERAGRFSGQRFIGENDWYRIGCEYLVRHPYYQKNQCWSGNGVESAPVLATSFALLFLSKGRTPVLISKLAHDPNENWNHHRQDAHNLVDFSSKELFKKQPLAWQVFDARRAGDLTRDRVKELTSDLLQSPVVYITGDKAPILDKQKDLIQEYVANGGFIMAEACCGSKDFDRGFRKDIALIFPDTPLKKLDPKHPIWFASGKWAVSPKDYELWGIDMGCKTVVVYSPQGLSCWWDSNATTKGKGQKAFQLGANIIAYATGLEPPKPRLTQMEVFSDDGPKKIKRGYLKVAQLRHDGDWQPAPRAMPNLMAEMRKLGMDVALQTEEVRAGDKDLTDFRFLYMHGRAEFSYSEAEIKKLRFNLNTGGLLLADACCGSKTFDTAFRKMIGEIFPGQKLEPIPLNDELFSKELNGTAITSVRCRREGATEFSNVAPALEGIKVNGRWVVIYSKYDIGCALEKHQSTDCKGHDHASAVMLGKAAVLYAMKR